MIIGAQVFSHARVKIYIIAVSTILSVTVKQAKQVENGERVDGIIMKGRQNNYRNFGTMYV